MSTCFRCLCCWNGNGFNSGHVRLKDLPEVRLDTSSMGGDVVIVKNGRRICGTGAALANAPLVQNKAYFEVKVQSTGVWGVGLATKSCSLQTVPLGVDNESWALHHDGIVHNNGEQIIKLSETPQEGDIIGLAYDHIELNFFLNGKALHCPVTGIKGTFFPVLYVDEGAILDVQFANFYHVPPDGFEQIMIEQSLL